MKVKVVLYNRNLTSVCAPQMVTGARGEVLGHSKFDGTKSFHTLEMPLEDYEKNAQSIAGVSHLAMRNWEPHFVVEGYDLLTGNTINISEKLREAEIPVAPMPGIPQAKYPEPPKVADVKPMPEPRNPDTYSAPPPFVPTQAKDDLSVPFFSLKKIAAQEGVDISEAEGMDGIRALIRKAREAKLQPA